MIELKNRVFKTWAYTVSHCVLILRSPLKFPDQDEYDENQVWNIDIEFSSVSYIDIPTILQGIEINELKENIPEKLNFYKTNFRNKIFEIKSNDVSYFIVAGGCCVGKNKWIAKDRIFDMSLEYDIIIGIY